jgi:hypothetical protein
MAPLLPILRGSLRSHVRMTVATKYPANIMAGLAPAIYTLPSAMPEMKLRTIAASPSHDQIVRHVGNDNAPRMVRNDTEVVS